MKKKLCFMVVLGLAFVAGASQLWADSTIERIKEKGVLVGANTDFDYAPFILSGSDGPEGFEVDLINAVAEKLGVKAKIVRIPWDGGVTMAWTDGYDWSLFDIAVAAITITDARREKCLFSDPYFVTGQAIVARSDSEGIKSHSDAKGKTLGILQGSTSSKAVESLGAISLPFPNYEEIIKAVLARIIDGAVVDGPVALDYEKQHPELKVLDGYLSKEEFGVAIPQGDHELEAVINQVISEMEESLKAKWL